MRTEIRGGTRLRFRKFRHEYEELFGIAAIGGDQTVRPKVGQLTFAQVRQGGDGKTLDAFDKRDTQHLGNCPEFADRQRAHGLVRLDKSQDIFPIQAQFRMGNEILGETVYARQTLVGIRGQRRQLPVISPGKVQQDIAGVPLQDILIIKYPIGGGRGFLLQTARCREIRADIADPLPGPFKTFKQLGAALRLQVHLLLPGMAPGMFLHLRQSEFYRRGARIQPSLALGMHYEQRRRYIAAFPQHGHRML